MDKELKDFINDWKINPEQLVAEKDGLKFHYSSKGLDGTPKVGISGLASWYSGQLEKGVTSEQTDEILADLSKEFMEIYNKVILPQQIQKQQKQQTK